MRTALLVVLGLALAFVTAANAQDKKKKEGKEVTLKGSITCAKCDLGKEDKCMTVIVVKDKEKDKGEPVVYYFDTKTHKAQHSQICRKAKEGSVKGTVTEKDGKKIITVTKTNFDTD